jgi:uncharacterized protein (UPF0262 family)
MWQYKLAAKPYYQMHFYANQEDRENISYSRNYEKVLLIKLNTTVFNIMKLMAHIKIKTKFLLQIRLITLDFYCMTASFYVALLHNMLVCVSSILMVQKGWHPKTSQLYFLHNLLLHHELKMLHYKKRIMCVCVCMYVCIYIYIYIYIFK